MELGDNEVSIGKDTITVTKQAGETIIKVIVTSQNGLETEEYEICVLEKSSNTNLEKVIVNDKETEVDENGKYKIGLVNSTKNINIEAIAEDAVSITSIDGEINTTHIAKKQETVLKRKNNLHIWNNCYSRKPEM